VANIWQVTWKWAGGIGGAGYSNLYFAATAGDATEALAAATKSRLLFDGVKSLIASGITITLNGDVRLLEDTTGDLVTIMTVSGPAAVNGGGAGSTYPAASGGCVDWLTGVVHGKHLMVGRTFIVPMHSTAYSAGKLASGAITTMGTAAEACRTASGPALGVWGRPRAVFTRPDGTVRPALTGAFASAISSRIPDKAVVLRSRRD
jgi:hypothetical protein